MDVYWRLVLGFLAKFPSGGIFCHWELSEKPEFEIIRLWFYFCRKNHSFFFLLWIPVYILKEECKMKWTKKAAASLVVVSMLVAECSSYSGQATVSAASVPTVTPTYYVSSTVKVTPIREPASVVYEGKNAEDMAALQSIIQEQKGLGASVSENLDNKEQYTWEDGGRLIKISRNACGLAGAAAKLEAACASVVKKTGNLKKLTFKTSTPSDFDAISFRHNKKIQSMYYVSDDKTVYNVCVAKAKTTADAKKVYKAFADYKKARLNNEYFKTDYTEAEQKIMKNAIYGRQGKYVWYISMSSVKKNQAGEKALKKEL